MTGAAAQISFARLYEGTRHRPFQLAGGHPAALLVHGFPGTPAEVRPLADHLHRAGWTVAAPLLPGFGVEIDSLPERRYEEWLETVIGSLRHLQSRHHPTLLVGFSMGAALSLAGATVQPPDGLALLAPFWKFKGPVWALLPLLRRVIPTFKPFRVLKVDFSDPEVRRGMAEFLPGMDLDDPDVRQAVRDFAVPVGMIDEVRKAGQAAWRAADRAAMPTLVVQGNKDELVSPALTQRLGERLSGPVTYRQVEAAHDLLDPEAPAWPSVSQAILQFANQVIAEATPVPGGTASEDPMPGSSWTLAVGRTGER